jgi:hypothetical protein
MLLGMTAACVRKTEPNGGAAIHSRDINEVKESATKTLMSIPGVVGVYVGETKEGTPCIGIMVVKKTEELERKLPRSLGGYPVIIDETGTIVPMDSSHQE